MASIAAGLAETQKRRSSDPISWYLATIGRIPLLTPAEEIELGNQVQAMMRLTEDGTVPADSESHSAQDRRMIRVGKRAKERMMKANLRLVVSVAKKYQGQGLSLEDLINEGNIGLIKAARRFDETRGFKFISYAVWWIRQSMTRAIACQSRTIRLPVHLYETISRIKKTTKVLSQEFGRKPTEEEIAESMEMTIEKLRFIAKSAQLPISLETPIGKNLTVRVDAPSLRRQVMADEQQYRELLRGERGLLSWEQKAVRRPEALDYSERFFLKILAVILA